MTWAQSGRDQQRGGCNVVTGQIIVDRGDLERVSYDDMLAGWLTSLVT